MLGFSVVVPEPSPNLLFSVVCLGVAAWSFLVARGTIETDRWPYDEHPEVAYWPAAGFVFLAIFGIVLAF